MESEQISPLADTVFQQLTDLSVAGMPHSIDGPRATMNSLSPTQLARRRVDVARWYLSLQQGVATDGRVAVVTAGPPGAGKSTLLKEEGILSREFRNIEADIIKDQLLRLAANAKDFDDLLARELADDRPVSLRELSSLVHRESTAIANAVTTETLRRGENAVIQGTLGWDGQPGRLLDALEVADYQELTIVDVEAPFDEVMQRAKRRWWLGRIDDADAMGGRFVAPQSLAGLYGEGGRSLCSENARVMFELSRSRIRSTLLMVDDLSRTVISNRSTADLDKIDDPVD